ncbi:MFS general substrate transporter [Penicillium antarcticum]|uniref:MFS general substrate transporter n=1 Tax=Penicillium antarcticum TaxID=416450 RepID=UPI0023A75AE1|nr:MFS general substrate transporter [Penicillium antarcticum]KAJ5295559.1 MFS general substrate transporter [Penicillium antarcticum]
MRLSQPDPAELKNGKDNANQGTLIKPRKTEDRDFLQSPSPSILSGPEKVLSIIIVTTMTFLGPAPMSIYFPILGSLSRDLQVSPSEMSLTITVYVITQALFSLLTASFSDQLGRRPVFIVRLTASLGANLGLAWQTSFTALMALRCLQSFGSSSLSVVSIATMTDIITRAGRAKYRIYTSSGYTLASLLGSVTGGLLAQFIGWQSVFWFLAIYAGVMLFITLVFLRESCRAVLYPLEYCQVSTPQPPSTLGQGVLDTIRLLGSWQTGLLVAFQAVLFCGTMAIFANIPLLFERQYGFQAWQVGLVYVPYAAGGFAACWIVSPLTARNVRRYRCLVGAESMDHRPQDFPFERACLEVILPLVYLACAWKNIIAFGHPVSGTTVKLSQGDHGELLIKSPAVFSHYLNDLAATKAAFTDDGFYRTGDLVSREDTKYFFHGRASTDFIKYYGYRIPISALEQKLNELPGMREGYILAMPDVNCGYRAAALIRLTQDADADLQTATFARTIGGGDYPAHSIGQNYSPRRCNAVFSYGPGWTQPGGGTGVHGATVGMSG